MRQISRRLLLTSSFVFASNASTISLATAQFNDRCLATGSLHQWDYFAQLEPDSVIWGVDQFKSAENFPASIHLPGAGLVGISIDEESHVKFLFGQVEYQGAHLMADDGRPTFPTTLTLYNGQEERTFDVEINRRTTAGIVIRSIVFQLGDFLSGARMIEGVLTIGDTEAAIPRFDLANLDEAQEAAVSLAVQLKREVPAEVCAPSKEPCFLTTAVCSAIGLPDDCFELRMLRRYRNDVMTRSQEGRNEISAYYELAPRVLSELAPGWGRWDWLVLYWGLVVPCALLIAAGWGRLAHHLYRWRVNRLVLACAERHTATGSG